MTNHQDLKELLVGFDDFLNSPPAGEDARRVRDYRHEAYAKWSPVAAGFSTLLDEREALVGENADLRLAHSECHQSMLAALGRVAALVGEVERLREAIKPFAAYYEAMTHMGRNYAKSGPLLGIETKATGFRELTVEDFALLGELSSIKEKSCG